MSKSRGARNFSLTLPAGVRLDKFLTEILATLEGGEDLSRSHLQRLIEGGGVTGIPANHLKSSFKAKIPVAIVVTLPEEKEVALKPFATEIPVLYEDAYLAVVHKPAGMTVHPGAGTGDDTMVHALMHNIDELAPNADRPGIVHRLDRETEGLMVVAKTEKARAALSLLFANRKIHKKYTALVWGRVKLPDEINGFIWRDTHNRKKMRFGYEEPVNTGRAREAELIISRQQQFKHATLLEIELITGRTHQIRATCAFFNAPIIGDTVYGNDAAKFKLYKVGREKRRGIEKSGMLLIAESLSFTHPFRRKKIEFSLPLPGRFAETEQALS